jgi:hypothetical protein
VAQAQLHWADVSPNNFYLLVPGLLGGGTVPSSQTFLIERSENVPEPNPVWYMLVGLALLMAGMVSRRHKAIP